MTDQNKYLLVSEQVVPEILLKVVAAKKLLEGGKCKTVGDALRETGISRTAFYKYKDHVFVLDQINKEKIVTLFFVLDDVAGILSDILSVLAKNKANVLTINQNIPIRSVANITISIRTDNMTVHIDKLINKLSLINGVNKIEILNRE